MLQSSERLNRLFSLLIQQLRCKLEFYETDGWRPLGDSNPCYRRERAVS